MFDKMIPLVFALALGACGSKPAIQLQTDAAKGRAVSAVVRSAPDGSLQVQKLFVTPKADQADDVECEDGLAPDGSTCVDEDGDDDDDEDDVECEDGLAPDGSACTDDDGDDDDDDDDQEGEDDSVRSFIAGNPVLLDGRRLDVLGISINPSGYPVPDGSVRFVGAFQSGQLMASQVQVATTVGTSIGGISEGIKNTGRGTWVLRLMGRDLNIDEQTMRLVSPDPLSEESDDIECVQEGEHSGDNEGC